VVARVLVSAVCTTLLFGSPAAAGQVDPKALLLRQSDLPAGFRLLPDQSGPRPNRELVSGGPDHARQVQRSGRVSGYVRIWNLRTRDDARLISSLADLCRTASGARIWLAWLDARARLQSGQLGHRRQRVGIGDEGWAYSDQDSATVGWRQGRAVALLSVWGLGLRKALVLARVQQRRIAATLRS
jgi:hypothetical protein